MAQSDSATKWIIFLRRYGPIPSNDNMYDEHIRRSSQKFQVEPIRFEHPLYKEILPCFDGSKEPTSIILTGTAGDGKTYLCGKIWELLGGSPEEWKRDNTYYRIQTTFRNNQAVNIHIIRDLTALGENDEDSIGMPVAELLQMLTRSIFDEEPHDIFLIAGNDGQLVEAWRKLPDTDYVKRARLLFEELLVKNQKQTPEARLLFFNLSMIASTSLFDQALQAFLEHPGWQACYARNADEQSVFGPRCPIRYNYELLQTPLVQKRLRQLLELCDYNALHIPIRQILLLLTNAVLGHPEYEHGLMKPGNIPHILQKGTAAKACLYNNIFGMNLTEIRRSRQTIFEYFSRFRIGHETTNRIHNLLIYGSEDEDNELRSDFEALLGPNTPYGVDQSYRAAQQDYIEGTDESETPGKEFLQQLLYHRQRLFFKVPEERERELRLWSLTVFTHAGEYLNRVVRVLQNEQKVARPILAHIIKGLNRIFVGMLISDTNALILASSISSSDARVSRMMESRLSVSHPLGEKIEMVLLNNMPVLRVVLSPEIECSLELHLVRYEFLCRVADGTLPGSFSRECYEDILAFKSQLLTALKQRTESGMSCLEDETHLSFNLFTLDDNGTVKDDTIEVNYDT